MKKLYLLLALFTFSIAGISQSVLQGIVKDLKTNEPIPFTTILFNGTQTGVSADIDGNFKVREGSFKTLTFSAIGYQKITLTAEELAAKNYQIQLSTNDYQLGEVIIVPGENPAHRIINLAIQNRDINNPEKNSPFFYESYNKMVFTTPTDTGKKSTLDSITIQSAIKEKIDSFELSTVLFLMESVAERNYIPPHHSKEVVTQSRISGLSTPFFSLLGTQLQSFSLYENFIAIYGINYLSPISKGSTSKYLFVLEDTLYVGNDTSFIISFRPRKNKYFNALQGVLSINSNNYAVEHFAAKQNDENGFPVSVQQRYQFVDGKQWFPSQLHIDILFIAEGSADINIKGSGKSYIRNVALKSSIEKKKIGNVNLKMADDIQHKEEAFWESIREIPLSQKEKDSYTYIDSIGKAENLDQMVYFSRGFIQGHVPIGKFNLLLNKLMKFNKYEGFRLGLGAETNDKFIKNIRIGGYGGYGFQDEAWKYGSHLKWMPNSERQFETKLSYSQDLISIGGVNYFRKTRDLTSTSNIQNLVNDQMDGVEKYEAEISFRALRDFHFTFFGNQQVRTFNSDYFFTNEKLFLNSFNSTEAGISIRFSYQEKFAELLGLTLPIITKYPIIYFKYSRGIKDALLGDFDYNRFDLNIFKSSVIKGLGTTSFQLNAGIIDNELPLTSLYGMRGIYDEEIKVASSYSFETMFPNEFFADQYVNLFFRHNFGKLLFQSTKFKPELLLVSSFAYGTMSQLENHRNFDFKTLDKGYLESGIQLNSLARIKYIYNGVYIGFGAGIYYRYGAYELPEMEDNLAIKLTTTFSL